MAKRQVYIHQLQAPAIKNLMPLAAGLITAYPKTMPTIAENYNFGIKILRENPQDTVRSYRNPDVLAFSAYSWNFRQSLEVARLAKLEDSNILVVFGGPMIALSQRPAELQIFFEKHPFVDVVVHGMGEWAFADILLAHIKGEGWDSIAGLSYRTPHEACGFTSTTPANFNKDLNELPSPFLDGTFDELLENYGDHITGTLWETNRGCPFSCSFCVQGDGVFNKVLTFDTERLYDELEWISRKKIEYIFAADANFGIRNRDSLIAEKIANLKLDTGYPKFFMVNWMKNSSKKILQTAETLRKGGIPARMTLSRQSFNENTLAAVKRENIKLSTYDEMKQEAAKKNVASYTELILGLPNDTFEAFVSGIEQAMDPHLTHVFVVYLCRLLDGTEMSTIAERQKYQYQTRTTRVGFGRSEYTHNGVDELEEIIVGSSTMSVSDWRKAHLFACMVLALYNCRLGFFVLNYLRQEHGVSLRDFFEFFIKEMENSSRYKVSNKAFGIVYQCQQSILEEKSALVTLDFTGNILFEAHEGACLICLNELDAFYNELWLLVNDYFVLKNIGFDKAVLREVFLYQVALIPTWNVPLDNSLSFEFNVPQYFQALCTNGEVISINKQKTYMEIEDEKGFFENPVEYSHHKLTIAMLKIAQVKSISTEKETEQKNFQISSIYDNLEFI